MNGKELLKTQKKFYLADTSLRYAVLGYEDSTIASMLENVVYLELKRRGYSVNIGKLATQEIDFIATKQNKRIYIQIAQQINSAKPEEREYHNLLRIQDNYPKFVLTLDSFTESNYQGIHTMTVSDFLLSDMF